MHGGGGDLVLSAISFVQYLGFPNIESVCELCLSWEWIKPSNSETAKTALLMLTFFHLATLTASRRRLLSAAAAGAEMVFRANLSLDIAIIRGHWSGCSAAGSQKENGDAFSEDEIQVEMSSVSATCMI